MARLGEKERSTFLAVRAVCARGLASIPLREEVSRILLRYLGADAYCAMEIDPVTTLPLDDVNFGWPRDYVVPLVENALFQSQTADTGYLVRSRRRAHIVDELLADTRPSEDPYFQYHVLPYGYRHEIQFMCLSGGLPRALFTFNRREARGAFEPRHLRLLESIAPHVAAAMHAACIRAALRESPATETGVVVLSDSGAIEIANEAARRVMGAGPNAEAPLALNVFLGLLRRSLVERRSPAITELGFTHRATEQAYRLVAERSVGEDGRWRAVVLLEPARPLDSDVGLLRLGLTTREVGVVVEVLRDENLVACADRLGCAPATVARHLKNVFGKLGVSSRRELALRLLGQAPNFEASTRGLP